MLLEDSRAFNNVLLELLDDVDLLEMLLISGNVGKCFVISSRSPGRTPLITPSKSYVVDVIAFSNYRMLLEEFSFLLSFSAANITDKEVIDVILNRKKPSSSSDKGVVKSLCIAPSCSNTSKTSISLHEIDTQQCEFAELDTISIDTAIFEDGVVGSTMPLTELAHQLGFGDIPRDVDVFEDCITSSNSPNMAKSSHLPLVQVKSQATNEIQLTKSMVPFSEKVEISQNISTTNVEVVETSQIGCSDVSRDLVRPLLRIASDFEPQKTISSFKLSYIYGMWHTLCECITQFSVESPENLKELEAGVALILKGLREVNIINLSPLEVLLEDFFQET
ncbi:hypothetical protein MTR67_048577 [Solanum verrucosum]|uniref:Uncharacterized protein n=1 Tax=Solanum verrucosum TaxID=315347 RepID=A0AAF0UYP8_SOLVR|nr:hypothetical protein MTR67_048577 [Solanum verrucosum]